MPTITTKDGTRIYYNDWGKGDPIVFSHGWPLSADAFEDQMLYLASRGYRCIAHDRRGHGRSSQPWNGNDMDTYADDLAVLVSAVPPLMLKTENNPGGLPIQAFDQIRTGVLTDRSQFFKDLSDPFYG